MTSIIQLLSPEFLGAERITITPDPNTSFNSLQPITVLFNYDLAEPEGIVLPLQLIVQPTIGPGGDGSGYTEHLFDEIRPSSYTFRVPGAGQHLIVLREYYHNRWFGRLLIDVQGDEFSQVEKLRQ